MRREGDRETYRVKEEKNIGRERQSERSDEYMGGGKSQ